MWRLHFRLFRGWVGGQSHQCGLFREADGKELVFFGANRVSLVGWTTTE